MRQMKRWMQGVLCVSVLAAGSASPARAVVSGDDVRLVGTTVAGHAARAVGHLDVTLPGTMVFRTAGTSGSSELAMPYDKVFEFGLSKEDAFHLGFFPAMFYGMVAPRPERHTLTVSWHDADGTGQEATFEVSKQISEHLMHVMYARARNACVRQEFGACSPVVPPSPPPRVLLTGPAPAAASASVPEPAAKP